MERYGRMSPYVLACWIVSASAGIMFGYNIGISGGVTSMDQFLRKFFPHVLERKMHASDNNYCKYDDQLLQLFTSSLYIAALVSSLFASKACTILGRKPTITMASIFFMSGAALCATAEALWMVILGRVLFGMGIGVGKEAVPQFLSEMGAVRHRGTVNMFFQVLVSIGILVASVINWGASQMKRDGWRVSLGVAAIPGFMLFVGSLAIVESPMSLIERGREEEGKAALKKIRGNHNDNDNDIEFDYQQMVEHARQVKKPFKKLFKKSRLPALLIATSLQLFQQFTGINAIIFYAPILFQTLGFKLEAALLSTMVAALLNVAATFVSLYAVDKVGRKKVLVQACMHMLLAQMAIGAILLGGLKDSGPLNQVLASVVVILVCSFVMSFAWSWGPMPWLIPTEIFPIETRAAGFGISVTTNMLFTFIIAQAFLSMMCRFKAYIFFFFSAWILVMGLFVHFLLPETKGVPTHEMEDRLWKKHAVWNNFF